MSYRSQRRGKAAGCVDWWCSLMFPSSCLTKKPNPPNKTQGKFLSFCVTSWYLHEFTSCYKAFVAVRQSNSPTTLFYWYKIQEDLWDSGGVTCMWSTLLFCGLCFQAFVYAGLHVCLCIPHESLYSAQNSEAVKQWTAVFLVYLRFWNVMTNRVVSSCLRVLLLKKVSFYYYFFPLPTSAMSRIEVVLCCWSVTTTEKSCLKTK